jgi:hypothetical protein
MHTLLDMRTVIDMMIWRKVDEIKPFAAQLGKIADNLETLWNDIWDSLPEDQRGGETAQTREAG